MKMRILLLMCCPCVVKFGALEIKKCFEGTEIDVATTVHKAQRSIVNFNSANTVLFETLSGGPNLPISDVHWTPTIMVAIS